eukprot:386833_1
MTSMDPQKQELKNQDDDDYDIESDNEEVENVLNLSKRNLSAIPPKTAKIKGSSATVLILTKNKLASFSHLNLFFELRILQLDRNNIDDELISTLPKLYKLQTLWLNNNNLWDLKRLLFVLKSQCPKLEYLSLLFNPLCPFTRIIGDGDDNKYIKYKH